MGNNRLSLLGKSREDEIILEEIKKDYGSDGVNIPKITYKMDYYSGFIPKLSSWITIDEQNERVNQKINGNKRLME